MMGKWEKATVSSAVVPVGIAPGMEACQRCIWLTDAQIILCFVCRCFAIAKNHIWSILNLTFNTFITIYYHLEILNLYANSHQGYTRDAL